MILDNDGCMLVWDSEETGPCYLEPIYVEYAKLLWDGGEERVRIIKKLRDEGGLSLRNAALVMKHVEANYFAGV